MLGTEIIQYSSPDEISVCTLANVALPLFVTKNKTFDFQKLHQVIRVMTRNLDRVIDKNCYPDTGSDNMKNEIPPWVWEIKDAKELKRIIRLIQSGEFLRKQNRAEKSSKSHRPIGLGIQGLADVFIILGMPFESEEAQILNRQIFETIYHGALTESIQLASEYGSYETYEGSPISRGIYQFNLWDITPSDLWDWKELENNRKQFGVRNSLLVAPMPTKSTSHIFGFNEVIQIY